ncbi:MAG: sulfatase-like hydrolase/transferase [Bacteroidota bacterium]
MMKKNACWYFLVSLFLCLGCEEESSIESLPNILWITSEDMNAFLGAYGDEYAYTPHLDQLAAEGIKFTHAYATAPVCSPSRACLITGVYATSLGTQHLRSYTRIPDFIKGFPEYLREKGYYCTNNDKEDYNFTKEDIWDESSKEAHWRKRPDGQPFFSVFNIETTHQSQIFGSDSAFYEKYGKLLSDKEKHDPDLAPVPPYHFDSEEVKKLWARYYDLVSLMDRRVGEILAELEEDGLTDNTIIFYYSDHGTGMPRSKRALYDSGLRVPLIIKAPPAWQKKLGLTPGTSSDDLVSFVDFPPTLLSMLDIPIPNYMQGKVFLGEKKEDIPYVIGHSDRVDEAYEASRTVRDKRFRYVRNYLSHTPLIQPNFYTDQSEIMQALYRQRRQTPALTNAQASMWALTRTYEELYDVSKDPFETTNLAGDSIYQEQLVKMRAQLDEWTVSTYDSGLLHEIDMVNIDDSSTIYESLRNPDYLPTDEILSFFQSRTGDDWNSETWLGYLQHPHPTIAYWASVSGLSRPITLYPPLSAIYNKADWGSPEVVGAFKKNLSHPSPAVALTAAQALCYQELPEAAYETLSSYLNSENKVARLYAARIVEEVMMTADQLAPLADQVTNIIADECQGLEWTQFYEVYTCWALSEAMKVKS